MGIWKPVSIAGGTYSDDTKPYSAQECINYLPEQAEVADTRSPAVLRGCPGMALFATVGAGPIRGMRNVEGRLFVVSGPSLYLVNVDGSSSNLGAIAGSQAVAMSHNQVAGGNQLIVTAGPSGYVYNTATGVFGAITDTGFPGAMSLGYINSYIIGVDPNGKYLFFSDLADATSYNELNRFESEASPDDLVGVIVNHLEVWALNKTTIEPFENNPTSAFNIFERIRGVVIEQGCASGASAVVLDNSVMLLGNDGIFYRFNGYSPKRISTHPVEQAIRNSDWSQCFAFTWTDRGHKVVYWTFPDGHTWGYDVASGQWHRRNSYGFNRWRLNALVNFGGGWIGGDSQTGKLYQVDWNVYHDDGDALVAERSPGVIHSNQNRAIVHAIELVFDTGRKEGIPTGLLGGVGRPLSSPSRTIPTIAGHLVNGIFGDAVDYTYTSAGGTAPRVISLLSGALPPGITNAAGHLTGNYTKAGTYTWTMRVTDNVGATADLLDSTTVTVQGIAAALFDWYTFDNTPVSSVTANSWAQTYGGGYSYEAGKKSQQFIPTVDERAPGPLAFNMDWGMFFWLDCTNPATGTPQFGCGEQYAFSSTPYAFIQVTSNGASSTFHVAAYDLSISNYVSSGEIAVASTRVFFCLRWDNANKQFTASLNGTDVATLTLGTVLSLTMTSVLFMKGYDSAFAAFTKKPDEWGIVRNHLLTQSEISYLYAGGAGKSYAEVVSDAS